MTEKIHTPSLLKIVVIGPKACGKSALASRITLQPHLPDYQSTVGVDFLAKLFEEENVKFHLWDLSGDKRFYSIFSNYIKSAKVVIAVFDTSDPYSAEECSTFVRQQVREGVISKNQTIIVVGTNSDKPVKGFSGTNGKDIALSLSAQYVHVSSKTGDGIEGLVDVLKKMAPIPPSPYLVISHKESKEGKWCNIM